MRLSNLLHLVFLGLSSAEKWRRLTETTVNQRDQLHILMFAVKQSAEGLETLVKAASNRNYLTRKQVAALTSHQDSSQRVEEYLKNNGAVIGKKTLYGEYIEAIAPLSLWEGLLQTQFSAFTTTGDVTIFRTEAYVTPVELQEHLHSILYTTDFPVEGAKSSIVTRSEKPSLRSAKVSVTPALISDYYNISSNIGDPRATQAVYESMGQNFSPSDVEAFLDDMGVTGNNVVLTARGHQNSTECAVNANACSEANLDLEYIIALCQNTTTTFAYDKSADFLTYAVFAADMETPPLVQSLSYGVDETEVPEEYAILFEMELIKLAAQGVTVLVASGDDGASSPNARQNKTMCGYNPSYPATSQFVTAVGATSGPEYGEAEVACQSNKGGVITSGGGFSKRVPLPRWQEKAVSAYFGGLDNSSRPVPGYGYGRGVPDVSLVGHNFQVLIGGSYFEISGTSASAPVFAAMISLVNSARFRKGLGPIGWLNPLLYQYADRFANDITVGDNFCVASQDDNPVCCEQGFKAARGWDPVTGLGSVDFAKLLPLLSSADIHTSSR